MIKNDSKIFPAPIQPDAAAKAFAALAQETRLKIIMMLVEEGSNGLCPCHLVDPLEISNANLSFHLKELENAGLVSKTKVGKYNHYRVNSEVISLLSNLLADYCNTHATAKGNCYANTRSI